MLLLLLSFLFLFSVCLFWNCYFVCLLVCCYSWWFLGVVVGGWGGGVGGRVAGGVHRLSVVLHKKSNGDPFQNFF